MSSKHRNRLDVIHSNMIQRCTNPNNPAYPDYGGRGISICEEWRTKRNFIKWAVETGYSDSLTIDRIDNNAGYSPSNCRWVSMRENCNNRRSCHYVTAFGETHSLKEWSKCLSISYNTLKKRIIDHKEDGETLLRRSRREVRN